MATAVDVNELEGFVTCGVCMCEYDTVNRKPKFLQCSHTICLVCLQKISFEKDIICPFCHNTFPKKDDIDSLPNNFYALQILKMSKKKDKSTPVSSETVFNWCWTCGLLKNLKCDPSSHVSFNITAETLNNFESLQKLKDEKTKLLRMAIEIRKEISQHLSFIVKSISAAGAQAQKFLDENNLLLVEMLSLKESKTSPSKVQSQEREQTTDLFLSKLVALVDDSEAGDTAETLKLKMIKSIELYRKKLNEATTLASECQLRENVKVSIRLFDEKDQRIPTWTWLENGFRLKNFPNSSINLTHIRPDLMLITHFIFSFLKKNKIELKGETRNQNTRQSALSILPRPARNNQFVLGQSIFILKLMKSGELVGEIQIRPTLTFNQQFLQKLGEFTYKSPKLFSTSIKKAVSEVYVLFKMENINFQPINPANVSRDRTANIAGEIGVVMDENSITGWNFLFPLDGFLNPKHQVFVNPVNQAKLFGHVIHSNALATLKQLSVITCKEREVYSLYVESI